MKLPKLISLSHQNLIHHKKQTLLTIIVVGSLFGLIIGFQLVIQGVENAVLGFNDQIFNKHVYIVASGCKSSELKARRRLAEKECLQHHQNSLEHIRCTDKHKNNIVLPCEVDPTHITKTLADRVRPYGGEIVGYVDMINVSGGLIELVPVDIIKNAIEIDITHKPQNVIAAVVGFNKAVELVESDIDKSKRFDQPMEFVKELRQKVIGKTFTIDNQEVLVAGVLPYGDHEFRVAETRYHFELLDVPLGAITYNQTGTLYINDQSVVVKELLSKGTVIKYAIIDFADKQLAYDYYQKEALRYQPDDFAREDDIYGAEINAGEYITNYLISTKNFEVFKQAITIASYAFLVVAVMISVFTFLKIIQQDDRLIALYKSLGATATDVFQIYFWYLLELAVLVAVYAVGVGVLIAAGVSYYYHRPFSAAASLFFGREISQMSWFIGFNWQTAQIVMIVLGSVIFTSVVAINQLSSKHIAKRLKQQ